MLQSRGGNVEINSASLAYETTGAGPPLVMPHGYMLDQHQWDDQFQSFASDLGRSGRATSPSRPPSGGCRVAQPPGIQRSGNDTQRV